mgnify:CR=1 FL=1
MTTSLLNTMLGVVGPARLIDLDDVDAAGAITGDVLLRGPGSHWINYPLGTITSTFVPYTGAAFNVDLGTKSLTATSLTAATVLTDTVIAENLYFNSVPYDSLICTSLTSGLLTNVQMGNNMSFFEGELSVTNAALTRTNDTNVTLTLGGSPTTALLAATSLTLGWTGTLAASRGGTGASTQTNNGICYYDGTKLTTSAYATLSFIAGDVDLFVSHPSVSGTSYEVLVTSSSCQYLMAYNTVSTFQGICGTAATENYWTLSTKGLGLSVSAAALWFGTTSNDDLKLYRNNTERLRLTSTGAYVPDLLSVGSAAPTINAMVSGTSLIQANVRLIVDYSASSGVNNYFLGSGNDGGLLQVFGCSNTLASPTAITTDGRLGGFFGRGYAVTGYSNAVAAMQFYAESTFTDTSTPTYITFATTASGAITRREVARFDSRGALLFADGLADGIGFRGSLGSYSIQYYNDGSRYPLRFVGASDAGTNRWFEFGNYTSDTYGGTWNPKVSINSATGYTTIGTVAIGPWPVSTTYALFGHSSLNQTSAGNYSMVVSSGGELNLNRPTGQTIYMRENNGSTSQLTVLTGGKVGINVNSPANYLDAWNNANSAVYNEVARFVVTNNSFGTNYSRLTLGQNATNVMFLEAANQSNTKGNILLQPFGGFVGVGVTSALSIFHVQGPANDWTARFTGSSTVGQSFGPVITAGSNSSDTSFQVLEKTAATTYFRIVGNGYIGIGTASPEDIVHIAKSGSATVGARIVLDNTATLATGNACEIAFLTDSGASISSYNANIKAIQDGSGFGYTAITFGTFGGAGTPDERVRITPAGNLGINTGATVSRKLTVQGSSALNDQLLYLKQGNDYGFSFNLDSFSSGDMTIFGVNFGAETAIMRFSRTAASVALGGIPTTTGGYPTRLDIYNGGVGASIKIQDSSGSGRGHIQIGSSSTATNNVHIGGEGNGAFYIWNGVFGSGVQKFVVDATGNMATSNASGLNYYAATGVSGSYIQLGNSTAGGYSTQLIHSSTHTLLQNGAGGILYLRTYTANYAAIVGEVNMGQEGALYIKNRASVPGTPSGGGYLYTESGALKYKGSSGTVTTVAAA